MHIDITRLVKNMKLNMFKKYWTFLIIIIALPIIIGLVYALDCPQYINVSSSDLITYYGSSLGLIFSVFIYLDTKKDEERKRHKNFCPKIVLTLVKVNNEDRKYEARIYNYDNENVIREVEINGESFVNAIKSKEYIKKTISFDCHNDCINLNEDIVEGFENGYPKEMLISCKDYDNNDWACYFREIFDNEPMYYNYYNEIV